MGNIQDYFEVDAMNISGIVNTGIIGGIAVIILMVVMIYIIATRNNKNEV